MQRTHTLRSLFSTALLLAAIPAAAQTNTPSETPDETPQPPTAITASSSFLEDPLIVTPTGFAQRAIETPYIIDLIDEDEIRDFGIRSVPEALKYTPGVMVQRTAAGQGSPFIRGFTGFRNVFLIDGVRLNNSTFREGPVQYWNTIDPFSIERLEVIKGPASVIYGSDAIGGTVNAITRSPYGYGEGNNFGGRTIVRGATNERSIGGRIEISPTFGTDAGLLLGGSFSEFGDLQGGSDVGTQPDTDYDQYGLDLKLEHFVGDNARVVFAHQRFRQNNAPRTHRTVNGINWEGLTNGSDLVREFDHERDLTYVQLLGDEVEGTLFDAFKLGISYHNQYEVRDRLTGGGSRRFNAARTESLGFIAQAQSRIGDDIRLTYGLDYYRDNVGSSEVRDGVVSVQGAVGDDATYDLLGAYIQGDIELTDRLTLVLGGRYTYAAADANRVDNPNVPGPDPAIPNNIISVDGSWNALAGSARIVYELEPDRLVTFGGVSQGFRAPNLSDLTRLDQSQTNVIEIPSPDLDPETFIAFEAGFKGQGENYAWQASYFYTIIQDQITRVPTGDTIGPDNVFSKSNVGDGYVNGIELDGTYKPTDHLTLFANATWMLGEVDTIVTPGGPTITEYISRNMPFTVNVGARYDVPDSPLWLYGIATGADTARFLSSANRNDTSRIPPGGTPGYVIFNLGGGWEFSENKILSVTIENLTNEDYRVHGSGVNGAGLGVIATLDFAF